MSKLASQLNSNGNELLHAVLLYRKRGFSVIPIRPRDKRPLVAWEEYQRRIASQEEIRNWWSRWPRANVGIVTGEVSNVIVLDVDGAEGEQTIKKNNLALPPTPCARTGGGGWHYYFRHPGGAVSNFAKKLPGLDLRGDGGLVVAPPSLHPSGRRYEWRIGIEEAELANPPSWLLELAQPVAGRGLSRTVGDWRKLVGQGVTRGERNNAVAALAGHLLRRYVDPYVVLELLLVWNRVKCRPPLPDEEVAATVNSVARIEARRRGVTANGKGA